MEDWLNRGREFYRTGDNAGAMRAFRHVIEEFVWSPIPISPDRVDALLRPAERGLLRCLEESSTGPGAARLLDEQIPLLYSDRDFDPMVDHLGLMSALTV